MSPMPISNVLAFGLDGVDVASLTEIDGVDSTVMPKKLDALAAEAKRSLRVSLIRSVLMPWTMISTVMTTDAAATFMVTSDLLTSANEAKLVCNRLVSA